MVIQSMKIMVNRRLTIKRIQKRSLKRKSKRLHGIRSLHKHGNPLPYKNVVAFVFVIRDKG